MSFMCSRTASEIPRCRRASFLAESGVVLASLKLHRRLKPRIRTAVLAAEDCPPSGLADDAGRSTVARGTRSRAVRLVHSIRVASQRGDPSSDRSAPECHPGVPATPSWDAGAAVDRHPDPDPSRDRRRRGDAGRRSQSGARVRHRRAPPAWCVIAPRSPTPKTPASCCRRWRIGLACGVGLYFLATFAMLFVLGTVWLLESFEPDPYSTFELTVTVKDKDKDSKDLKPGIEHVLTRYRIPFELRTTSPDDIAYEVKVPLRAIPIRYRRPSPDSIRSRRSK